MAKNELICLALTFCRQSHGYAINEFIKVLRLNRFTTISKASLYNCFKRLEEQNCLTFTTEREGEMPERKVYSITEKGIERFIEECRIGLASTENKDGIFTLAVTFNMAMEPSEAIEILKVRAIKIEEEIDELKRDLEKTCEYGLDHSSILCRQGIRSKELQIEANNEFIKLYEEKPDYYSVHVKNLYSGMM